MKIGVKKVVMPASKWRMEITNSLLTLQQVTDGQTFFYSGSYAVETDDELSILLTGNLIEKGTQSTFIPVLRFDKLKKSWFLVGSGGSEGAILSRD